MQDPMNSTPVYQQVDELKFQHDSTLFLLQQVNTAETKALLSKLQAMDLSNVLSFDQMSDGVAIDLTEYMHIVTQRIQRAWVGWQAVIVGEESFIWQLVQVLAAQGLMKAEMQLICSTGSRHIYCVHCGQQQIQNNAQEDFCHCEKCGVYLLIRSHFSQRLGAYMGVCADANHPQGAVA